MSRPARPLGLRGRLYAWFLTGPMGRVAAFFGDLGAYWISALRRRLRERRG